MWLLPPKAEVGMALSSAMAPHQAGQQPDMHLLRHHQQQQELAKKRAARGVPVSAAAILSPDATPEEVMAAHAGNLDLFRRQELAAGAVWSLVDGNQRAKSFIRNVLRARRRGRRWSPSGR